VRRRADGQPPTLSLPPNLVVNATSPAGAVVSYSVSATDDVDLSPNVGCAPPSASTFPIGLTTVACSGTDASGNSASGRFTVEVKGAEQQPADLDPARDRRLAAAAYGQDVPDRQAAGSTACMRRRPATSATLQTTQTRVMRYPAGPRVLRPFGGRPVSAPRSRAGSPERC
jgi:hypothetical protein